MLGSPNAPYSDKASDCADAFDATTDAGIDGYLPY
jgi:hypothetical protein